MADHPGVPFVQASGYSSGRPDGPPLWIVVHDMEAGESSDRAENTAQYFATGAGGRDVSSHYCVDNDSVIQCVSLSDVAWTVGNRPGNNRGINWELAGFASQGRGEWLDDFGRAMFAQMAPIVRADAERFGIPLVRRTVAELKAFVPGVTSHNDLGLAFGGTDHTDPGPNFPWDEFLQIMTGTEEGDMALTAIQTKDVNGDTIFIHPWNGTFRRVVKSDNPWILKNVLQAYAFAGIAINSASWPGPYDFSDPAIWTWAGFEVKPEGAVTFSPADLAKVAEAAKAGAEAGAPTHDELVKAAQEGSELASDS